jgi:hypothetical protein
MSTNDSFDDFVNKMLTDYQGQDPTIDIAPATLTFIKTAAYASMLWGLQKQIIETGKKPFPDVCNLVDVKHWAQIKGIPNIDSFIDADGNFSRLADEVLSRMQNAEAGGNEKDWVRWAKECSFDHVSYMEYCIKAKVFEDKRYTGSVDIVIVSDRTENDGGEQVPSSQLLSAVYDYLESQRTLGVAKNFVVVAPEKVLQSVAMNASDGSSRVTNEIIDTIKNNVIDYLKSLDPGATMYRAQLEAIAINLGVNVDSIYPDSNITVSAGPESYERIWPDVDNITIAQA